MTVATTTAASNGAHSEVLASLKARMDEQCDRLQRAEAAIDAAGEALREARGRARAAALAHLNLRQLRGEDARLATAGELNGAAEADHAARVELDVTHGRYAAARAERDLAEASLTRATEAWEEAWCEDWVRAHRPAAVQRLEHAQAEVALINGRGAGGQARATAVVAPARAALNAALAEARAALAELSAETEMGR